MRSNSNSQQVWAQDCHVERQRCQWPSLGARLQCMGHLGPCQRKLDLSHPSTCLNAQPAPNGIRFEAGPQRQNLETLEDGGSLQCLVVPGDVSRSPVVPSPCPDVCAAVEQQFRYFSVGSLRAANEAWSYRCRLASRPGNAQLPGSAQYSPLSQTRRTSDCSSRRSSKAVSHS